MKKLIAGFALLLTGTAAQAQSDYALTFSIPGPVVIQGMAYTEVLLDVNQESRFLSATGMIGGPEGHYPVTGSCFITVGNGAYCNLQVDTSSVTITLQSDLNGTFTVRDSVGDTIGSGSLVLTSAQ